MAGFRPSSQASFSPPHSLGCVVRPQRHSASSARQPPATWVTAYGLMYTSLSGMRRPRQQFALGLRRCGVRRRRVRPAADRPEPETRHRWTSLARPKFERRDLTTDLIIDSGTASIATAAGDRALRLQRRQRHRLLSGRRHRNHRLPARRPGLERRLRPPGGHRPRVPHRCQPCTRARMGPHVGLPREGEPGRGEPDALGSETGDALRVLNPSSRPDRQAVREAVAVRLDGRDQADQEGRDHHGTQVQPGRAGRRLDRQVEAERALDEAGQQREQLRRSGRRP
jgi:hypothetical protein